MPKQKTVTIGGKEYILQHPGVKWLLECSDRCQNEHGILQKSLYYAELLENVVVDPQGLKIEDFGDDMETFMALINEIRSFLYSNK